MKKNIKQVGVAFSFAILLSAAPCTMIQARAIVEKSFAMQPTEPSSENATQEQQEKLNRFAQEITTFVRTVDGAFKSFFDTKNRESYTKHVNRFKQHLDGFLKRTFASLEAERKRAPQGDAYHTAVNTTHAIVHEIFAKIIVLYNVFEKNRGTKDAKQLAKDLIAAEKIATKNIDQLLNKLGTLQQQLKAIEPQLAQRIMALRAAIIHQMKGPKPSQITLFAGIAHRLNCK